MFAIRIKELRQSMNHTQQQVADSIGVSRPAYTAYEAGNRQPDFDILMKIASYFGVTVDYLLGTNNVPEWANENDVVDLQDFLNSNQHMAYGGENLTEEEEQQLRVALETIFWKHRKKDMTTRG